MNFRHRLRRGGLCILLITGATVALAQPLRSEADGGTSGGDTQTLTPAQIMDIAYAAGWKMHAAGFDRAENVRSLPEESSEYRRVSDTIMVTLEDESVRDEALRRQYFSVPAANRIAAIAAHEHCHAFLIKHRHHLPPAVEAAAEACLVYPEASGPRLFDEAFCDVAAINTYGEPARRMFEAVRAEGDDDNTHDIFRYFPHSNPVFRAAVAAIDTGEPNLVTRTARAVATSCQMPELQAFTGKLEKAYATDLTEAFAKYTNLPPDQRMNIELKPVKQWCAKGGKKIERLRQDIGDAPLMGFEAVYEACRRFIADLGLPFSPYPERAMQRCGIRQAEFQRSYCTAVAVDVSKPVMPHGKIGLKDYLAIADWRFGKNSLPSRMLQDELDYAIGIYATGKPHDPMDISLRIEYACGAKPGELSDVIPVSEIPGLAELLGNRSTK